MSVVKRIIFIISFLACFISSVLLAAEIEYITENYPPYNFEGENGQAIGINVDILVEMFKEMKNGKTRSDIKILPWVRGIRNVKQRDKSNMIFSTVRTTEREALFKWVGPLVPSKNGVIVLKGNPKKIILNTKLDYSKYRFGAVRDDVGDEFLQQKGVDVSRIDYSKSIIILVKKLKHGRLDAFVNSLDSARWFSSEAGIEPGDIEMILDPHLEQHYFAFNLSIANHVIDEYQNALDKVKKNTDLMKQIKDRYVR